MFHLVRILDFTQILVLASLITISTAQYQTSALGGKYTGQSSYYPTQSGPYSGQTSSYTSPSEESSASSNPTSRTLGLLGGGGGGLLGGLLGGGGLSGGRGLLSSLFGLGGYRSPISPAYPVPVPVPGYGPYPGLFPGGYGGYPFYGGYYG